MNSREDQNKQTNEAHPRLKAELSSDGAHLQKITAGVPSSTIVADPKEYPAAPFILDMDETEHTDMGSGNLSLTYTDFTLPGKNGFDLVINRVYNSSMSNLQDLTAGFDDDLTLYTWTIYFTCNCEDEETGVQYNGVQGVLKDPTGGYTTYQEAEAAANHERYSENDVIDIRVNGKSREVVIRWIKNDITITENTDYKLISALRPNDHLTNTWGLGQGWGFGFPSVEVVKENYKRGKTGRYELKYYYDLHLGDGRVLRMQDGAVVYVSGEKRNGFKDYQLFDVTFLRNRETENGKNKYELSYQDGRKAYFIQRDDSAIDLVKMTDRFGNAIRFTRTGGKLVITDTLNRTIQLIKAAAGNGYTLTWELGGGQTIVYTVEQESLTDGYSVSRLVSVKDPAGRVTRYEYAPKQKAAVSFRPAENGDKGAAITYQALNKVVYPTGASAQYDYYYVSKIGKEFQGRRSMIQLKSRKSIDSGGTVKNLREYSYTEAWNLLYEDEGDSRTKAGEALYIASSQVTAGERVDRYEFDYRRPAKTESTLVGGQEVRRKESGNWFCQLLPRKETVSDKQDGKILSSVVEREYDLKGNVTSETQPLRGRMTMQYDETCNLPLQREYQKDDAAAIREEYTLNAAKTLAEWKKVYENGALKEAIHFTYDAVTHNLKEERKHFYLSLTNSEKDLVTAYHYDAAQYQGALPSRKQTGAQSESYTYDGFGRILTRTDGLNHTTTYRYDALGRVTAEIYADKTEKRTAYDDLQNTLTQTDELGNRTRYAYTGLGKIAQAYALTTPETLLFSYEYDAKNQLLKEHAYNGGGTTSTAYAYDAFGRILSKTVNGPAMSQPYEEKYTYEDTYDPVKKTRRETKEIVGSGGAPSLITAQVKDEQGQVVEEIGGGYVTRYSYDRMGNRISQTDPGRTESTAEWTYDYAGRVREEKRRQEDGTLAAAETQYNALGEKESFRDFLGNVTRYEYDSAGLLTRQSSDFSGETKAVTRYGYNAAGKVTRMEVLAQGGAYRRTEYEYDARDRVEYTRQYDGAETFYTQFVYDGAGNKAAVYTGMKSKSTAGASKTAYSYDRYGNVTQMVDPEGRTETNRYNAYGRLESRTDRNGIVTAYSYDGLNRVLSENAGGNVRSYLYYQNGLKAAEEQAGGVRICYAEYDSRGLLKKQTEEGAGSPIEKRYGYDENGNRTSFLVLKDGVPLLEQGYSYDTQKRLKEVRRGSSAVARYGYDQNGNRTSLSYPESGLVVSYAYNEANLVTELRNWKGDKELSAYSYRYAPDGNQIRKAERVGGKAEKAVLYVYDGLGRLKEEQEEGGRRITYAYDERSNRREMRVREADGRETITRYRYDKSNRLLEEGKAYPGAEEHFYYRYDGNGNQLQRQWEKIEEKGGSDKGKAGFREKEDGVVVLERREYNAYNGLERLWQDGKEERYRYRPDGLRESKEWKGKRRYHIWDGEEMVGEYNGNGSVAGRYIRGINLIANELDGQRQYYLYNAHGDVVQRTDGKGVLLKRYEYDAFGNERE
ncbi:MAG: RHS repeat protein, partial [Provencibacterium sp.]|nr:RHS repeat protein [Provencibacterium sp.]